MRSVGSKRRIVLGASLAAAGLLALPQAASAAAIDVDTTADQYGAGPECSLREAIKSSANGAPFGGCTGVGAFGSDVIELPAGTYALTRPGANENLGATGDLDISSGLSLVHTGIEPATVDAKGIDRVFDVFAPAPVEINGIEIRGGSANTDGGGVLKQSAPTLTLRNVTVRGSQAVNDGGGVASYGSTALENSTVTANAARGSGGGVYGAGGSSVNFYNSTVSANAADANGDGTGNGGGISTVASMSTYNTIVADNKDGSPNPAAQVPDCATGPSFFPRYTLIENFQPGQCLVGFNPGTNIVGTDPKLGPLTRSGGPTPTRALGKGSAALGAGTGTGIDLCTSSDQRGLPRALGGVCDLGAVEEASCAGVRVNLIGTTGDDKLVATAKSNGVLALGGNDTVKGGKGKDGICAGPGRDKVKAGNGRDKIKGESGRDNLKGQNGPDKLLGGPGKDRCNGGKGKDKGPGCEIKRKIP